MVAFDFIELNCVFGIYVITGTSQMNAHRLVLVIPFIWQYHLKMSGLGSFRNDIRQVYLERCHKLTLEYCTIVAAFLLNDFNGIIIGHQRKTGVTRRDDLTELQ